MVLCRGCNNVSGYRWMRELWGCTRCGTTWPAERGGRLGDLKRKVQAWLLRLALGNRKFFYMTETLQHVVSMRGMHYADIRVRKDGQNHVVEADWLKDLQRIVRDVNVKNRFESRKETKIAKILRAIRSRQKVTVRPPCVAEPLPEDGGDCESGA